MDPDSFPPRARPVPATWTPQDEHGDSLPEAEALDEWISTCNQVVPLGGHFTVEEGLVFNRWGMVGRVEEVRFFSFPQPREQPFTVPQPYFFLRAWSPPLVNNCFPHDTRRENTRPPCRLAG